MALGFVFKNHELLFMGGSFGYFTNVWLTGILGNIGAGLFILFAFVVFLIVGYNFSFKLYKKEEIKTW